MKIIKKISNKNFVLKAVFKDDKKENENIIEEFLYITEIIENKMAYIFLGKKEDFNISLMNKAIDKIVNSKIRNYEIDIETFINNEKLVTVCSLVRTFTNRNHYFNGDDLYSAKTNTKKEKFDFILITDWEHAEEKAKESLIVAKNVNLARRFQATPPNICNSEWLAKEMETILKKSKNKNVSYNILGRNEIEKEKMELFLSVNKGSFYDPRLVVVEYKGNANSKDKIVLVGKGITFDSGGYNLKPSNAIQGMKYDMSGAAISFATFMSVIEFNPKINFSIILPLTDNRISSNANLPDSIWTSMNGKTVEINNTDAEGRLILADGITYGIRKLNATKIIDIATLTGAIIVSLGKTYTGLWSTNDQDWNLMSHLGNKNNELVWRMPFHEDFLENIKKSNFADLKNTDLTGKGGSISAAMFLKEFIEEGVDYMHLDIAGTAGDGDDPKGVMVKTLTKFIIKKGLENDNK